MSKYIPCSCGQTHEAMKSWRVTARRYNRSAFNGYKRTPSPYSEIRCLKCRGCWRTKAAYVDSLPDSKPGEE